MIDVFNFRKYWISRKNSCRRSSTFTRVIDIIRYNGRNIRKEIMEPYKNKNVLDLCCGIGVSTVENGIGVDTSFEMLKVGQRLNINNKQNKTFYLSNAETYVSSEDIDIVTCMFAFHEMPEYAHKKIIKNAMKIAKEELIIVDIASDYKPKDIMLSGEPYLLDYMSSIDITLQDFEKNSLLTDTSIFGNINANNIDNIVI